MSTRRTTAGGALRLVLGTVLLVLFGLLFALYLLPSAGSADERSATSLELDGRRALFLFLGSELMGYTPEAWRGAPAELPSGPHLLVLPAAPPVHAYSIDGGDDGERVTPRRLRSPLHYRRFLEAGGTLLATAEEDVLRFLSEELGLVEVEELDVERPDEVAVDTLPEVTFASGARVRPVGRGGSWFTGGEEGVELETLARDAEGRDLVVRLEVGRGACVLVASRDWFRNQVLRRPENAVRVVRLFEELEPFQRVLFDEYALGSWKPPSATGLALGPRPRILTLHLLALAALLLWRAVGRRGFAREPDAARALSPLTRARGLAGLYLRRRRFSLLAHQLRSASLRRLGRGARGREAQSALGLAEDTSHAHEVEELIGRLGPAADRSGFAERARRAYLGTEVQAVDDLERLDREITAVEAQWAELRGSSS